jgi:hypothetical protein
MTPTRTIDTLRRSGVRKHAKDAARIILEQAMAPGLDATESVMVRLGEDGFTIAAIPTGSMMK